MKYFLDTEFHEFKKKPLIGKAIDTIELISIGIVAEDDREYYAICKEFDLKAAWKNEWLKEHVLKAIHVELSSMDGRTGMQGSFKDFKRLMNKYGKTKKQIAEEIKEFVGYSETGYVMTEDSKYELEKNIKQYDLKEVTTNKWFPTIEFYAYYADYDWVVFCWLFGRMIDLPKGFPMYCKDLKQMLDEKWSPFRSDYHAAKVHPYYPKQVNEHNALDDAKWNKDLYKFITTL